MTASMTTKADEAYVALRRAIVTGEVPSGEPLDEAELVRLTRTGRTPLREALKRLARDQFVLWPARKTPYVHAMSMEDVRSLYESRMLLEVPAARLAAGRATGPQFEEMQRCGDELCAAAVRGDVYGSIEADHALHIAITKGANNRFLTGAVDRLNCGSLRLWFVAHQRLGLERVPEDHQDIIDALRSRDADGAELAVRKHIQESFDRQMKFDPSGTWTLDPIAKHNHQSLTASY